MHSSWMRTARPLTIVSGPVKGGGPAWGSCPGGGPVQGCGDLVQGWWWSCPGGRGGPVQEEVVDLSPPPHWPDNLPPKTPTPL